MLRVSMDSPIAWVMRSINLSLSTIHYALELPRGGLESHLLSLIQCDRLNVHADLGPVHGYFLAVLALETLTVHRRRYFVRVIRRGMEEHYFVAHLRTCRTSEADLDRKPIDWGFRIYSHRFPPMRIR